MLESAEEVALYHGEEFEKNVIERGYFALVKHVNRILKIRVGHGMAEEGVIKWLWGSLGLCICAIPVFGGSALGMKGGDLGSRTEGQYPNFGYFQCADEWQVLSRTEGCYYPQVMPLEESCIAIRSAGQNN